jgi:soluble lytic murein transglycosylase-like protein
MRQRIITLFALALAVVALGACSASDVIRPDGLKSLYGTPAPGAPGGKADVRSSGQKEYYINLARADALDAGIDPDCFQRQIQQESGFDPNATGGDGEVGIAQFMPKTAAGLGINPADPVASLKGAAGLMGRFYHKYGSYEQALAAYNSGSGNLAVAIRRCGGAWQSCLPRSTQAYIRIVMGG